MIRENSLGESVELRVCEYPLTIGPSASPLITVSLAVEQWNEWLGVDLLLMTDESPMVEVDAGFVGDYEEGDEAGLAVVDFDDDGCITHVAVTISSDILYDEDYTALVLLHETGHALSLSDDPGPPATVDLRSIMSSPLDVLGVLTEHDRRLLLE